MRAALAVCVVLLLAWQSTTMAAQSGRRIPRTRPSTSPPASEPATAPSAAPEPPAQVPTPDGEKIEILAAQYRASFGIRQDVCDAVVAACVREIGESSIAMTMPGGELSRKAAIEKAKASTKGYVLWFEFSFDIDSNDPAALPSSDNSLLVAHYVLFEPVTAKVRTQARIYFRSYDGYSSRGPTIGARGGQALSPTETGLKAAAAVLDTLERDLLPRR